MASSLFTAITVVAGVTFSSVMTCPPSSPTVLTKADKTRFGSPGGEHLTNPGWFGGTNKV
jgi:hypothetical protein